MSPKAPSDEELLDLLYEASGDPVVWSQFLAAIARRLNGRMVAFISHNPTSRTYPLVVSVGADPELQRLYGEYYGAKDPWVLAGQEKLVEGWVERGSSLCAPSEMMKTEFYNDFYRRYPHFYPLGAIIEHQGDHRTFLTIMRDRSQSDFSDSDVAFVRSLFPHLRRALKIHRKIFDLRQTAQATAGVLEALDVALLGLDENGHILFENRQAELVLRAGAVLSSKDGRIVARDPREDAALRRLVKAACSPESDRGPGDAITMHWDGHSLHLTVLPFTAREDIFPSRPRVLVTISDPDGPAKSRERVLTSLFHFTPAENRVAALLLKGLDPKEIAVRTRTTQNTVRTHLKSIYGKTGVTRQSHLVRLVSELPGSP